MRRFYVLLIAMIPLLGFCQEPETSEPEVRKVPPIVTSMQAPVTLPAKPRLASGTQIWLRLAEDVKVKKVKAGDVVHFVLYHDLYYRDVLLAKAGTPVDADVKEAKGAKMVNRGSHLVISIHGLSLMNHQTVPLLGESNYRGGAGTGGHVAGAILEPIGHCNAAPCLLYDVPALPVAGLLALFTHGENKNAKLDTTGVAYVSGDFDLDLNSLPAAPAGGQEMAEIRILRGNFGRLYSRDLYCNGVPLAHLSSGKVLELKVKPGDYRFAIDPKKDYFDLYLPPGAKLDLMTDYQRVWNLRENEASIDTQTFSPFHSQRKAGEMLRKAKPVEKDDIYTTECQPLPTHVTQ